MEMHLPKYEIREELMGDLFRSPLIVSHWEETESGIIPTPPNLDVEKYEMLEEMGMMFSLFAYADGVRVGYALNFITQAMHYKDITLCNCDALFVAKEHRKSSLGIKLIRETQRIAKERGALEMLWTAKPDTELARILPRMGFNLQEIVFNKKL